MESWLLNINVQTTILQGREVEVVKRPLFEISPDKFILGPYESQIVTIEGLSTR